MKPREVNAILVDDNADALQLLKLMLEQHAPEIKVLDTFTNPSQALYAIRENQPDVVFMDIEMPEMSGFELKSFLGEIPALVVFVTGHTEAAVTALRASAFDFLSKPISPVQILGCAKRIRDELKKKASAKEGPMHNDSHKSRILVNRHDKAFVLDADKIIYIQAFGAYSTIYAMGYEVIESSKPISYYEAKVDPKKFYRAHRSYLINLDQVKEVVKKDNIGILNLAEGRTIELAKGQLYKLLALLSGNDGES